MLLAKFRPRAAGREQAYQAILTRRHHRNPHVRTTPFAKVDNTNKHVAGDPNDAVTWDETRKQTANSAQLTMNFHLFFVLTIALVTVAVIADFSVLAVGALMVDPKLGTIRAICTGLAFAN